MGASLCVQEMQALPVLERLDLSAAKQSGKALAPWYRCEEGMRLSFSGYRCRRCTAANIIQTSGHPCPSLCYAGTRRSPACACLSQSAPAGCWQVLPLVPPEEKLWLPCTGLDALCGNTLTIAHAALLLVRCCLKASACGVPAGAAAGAPGRGILVALHRPGRAVREHAPDRAGRPGGRRLPG